MYIAIIGDMVKSRQLDNRTEVQERLKKVLSDVNNRYEEEIAACFAITLGDEFQGLLKCSDHLIAIIDEIKVAMYPVMFRFGIGFGAITTEIDRGAAIGADGPAFYAARDAIQEVAASIAKNEQAAKDVIIQCDQSAQSYVAIINATLATSYYIECQWTDKQREITRLLSLNPSLSQKALAIELGISQSSIQRRIQSSGYYTYAYAKEESVKFIKLVWEVLSND